MANGRQVTRARPQQMAAPQQQMLAPGTRDGGWVWDGSNWVCCDGDQGFPCPPVPGFHPWFDPQTNPWYPGANAGVSFGTTAPSFPIRGNFWWDGIRLWMFDGAAWVDIVESAINGGSGGTGSGGVVISATPPGSPIVGMQWWDGSQMRVWDGSAWQVVGPGGTVGPVPTTTNVFAIAAPTNLTVGPGTWSVVPFTATPTVDPQLGWNATTKVYKPVKPGFYFFESRAYTAAAGGLALLKNDTGAFTSLASDIVLNIASTPATGGWMQSSAITLMNGTTDFVRLFGFATDSTFRAAGGNPVLGAVLLP